jgi:hypothetical protein
VNELFVQDIWYGLVVSWKLGREQLVVCLMVVADLIDATGRWNVTKIRKYLFNTYAEAVLCIKRLKANFDDIFLGYRNVRYLFS